MIEPLNKFLYDRLEAEFGQVKIACEGEAMTGQYSSSGGRRSFEIREAGEYYRVCCPHCGDTRHRLWVNHRWGVQAPGDAGASLNWALVCYNNHCYEGADGFLRRRDLERRIYMQMRPSDRQQLPVRAGVIQEQLTESVEPGDLVPITALPQDHPAVVYLRDVRKFDIAQINQDYGPITYCTEIYDNKYWLAKNRIIVPIRMRGVYAGWQARYVGDPPSKSIPKYWTMPGLAKRLVLYDYDAAYHMPFVIVEEGVTDVWRTGAGAVSVLGKSLHPRQADLIVARWPAAVLLLDPEALEESQAACQRLRSRIPVAIVQLPDGSDPATTPQDRLWQLIFDSSKSQGIDLERMLLQHTASI